VNEKLEIKRKNEITGENIYENEKSLCVAIDKQKNAVIMVRRINNIN